MTPNRLPSTDGFTFRAATHQYFLGERELPGVSAILKTAGLAPSGRAIPSAASLRGMHIHRACALLDQEDLEWESLDQTYVGYVTAYARFKAETAFVPRRIEQPCYHPTLLFAGCPDREGLLLGDPVVLDLKSGHEEDWHRWQDAGYQLLGGEAWASHRRACLYLHQDGSYALMWHEESLDLAVFASARLITYAKWGQQVRRGARQARFATPSCVEGAIASQLSRIALQP